MKKELFGYLPSGKAIYSYEFGNERLTATVITYGAAVQKLVSYGRDVIGGFDTIDGYLADDGHQGAIVGRYANRIKDARFTLNGKVYELERNCEGKHHLHSGSAGLCKKLWEAEVLGENALLLRTIAADGDGNYPGNLQVSVRYTIEDDCLSIAYEAMTDKETPVNITNHMYFNLDGLGGDILEHQVQIFASGVSEIDEDLTPTGTILPTRGTIFDFTIPHTIGERLDDRFGGYDHNYLLDGDRIGRAPTLAAIVENTDRRLSVLTNRPCMQFYIGNSMNGTHNFKNNIRQVIHGAFCLETQFAPYSIVSGECMLKAGETFSSETIYKIEKR